LPAIKIADDHPVSHAVTSRKKYAVSENAAGGCRPATVQPPIASIVAINKLAALPILISAAVVPPSSTIVEDVGFPAQPQASSSSLG